MTDVGLAALDRIYRELQIDEPWTVRADREFSWIGHRLQQTVRASRLFDDQDLSLSRLAASVLVVEDVSEPETVVLSVLNAANRHAVGNAYTFVPTARTIVATAVAYVHEETLQWRAQQFGALAILQLCLAESETTWLAVKTGGRVAVAAHPSSGARKEPDDMLNVLDGVFAPSGWQVSRFADKFELEAIAEMTRHSSNAASLGADETGLSLEVSYGEGTSLTILKTDEPHRRLGQGLTVRMSLPNIVAPDDGDRIASVLNSHEAIGSANTSHHGAWCWDEWPTTGRCLAYHLFMPNVMHRQGISQDVVFSAVRRAQWVDELLNGKCSSANVWDTVSRRYGVKPGGQDTDSS